MATEKEKQLSQLLRDTLPIELYTFVKRVASHNGVTSYSALVSLLRASLSAFLKSRLPDPPNLQRQEQLKKLARRIGEFDDKSWKKLSSEAQDWVNGAIERINDEAPLLDLSLSTEYELLEAIRASISSARPQKDRKRKDRQVRQPPAAPPDGFMTPPQAAQLIGMSGVTVREWIFYGYGGQRGGDNKDKPKLKYHRVGKSLFVRKDEFDNFLLNVVLPAKEKQDLEGRMPESQKHTLEGVQLYLAEQTGGQVAGNNHTGEGDDNG